MVAEFQELAVTRDSGGNEALLADTRSERIPREAMVTDLSLSRSRSAPLMKNDTLKALEARFQELSILHYQFLIPELQECFLEHVPEARNRPLSEKGLRFLRHQPKVWGIKYEESERGSNLTTEVLGISRRWSDSVCVICSRSELLFIRLENFVHFWKWFSGLMPCIKASRGKIAS